MDSLILGTGCVFSTSCVQGTEPGIGDGVIDKAGPIRAHAALPECAGSGTSVSVTQSFS